MERFWCIDSPQANTNSQDSPRPRFGGNHHLPLYSILYAWPRGLHLNVIFSKLGLSWLWRLIISYVDLQLKWGLKQSCNPCQKLFNDMWHIACTQVIQGDYQLLVVRNQISTLIPTLLLAITYVLSIQMGHARPF